MLIPCCHITIESTDGSKKYTFDYVNSVDIVTAWKNLTDTCTIMQPRNIKLSQAQLRDLITPGMKVTVELGYEDQQLRPVLHTEFTGYVVRIAPKLPLEIYCEDEMYQLKKGSFTRSFGAGTILDDVIKYIAPGYQYSTFGTVTLGAFSVSKATPVEVLTEIKKVTGLNAFFRNGILTVGKPYDSTTLTHRNYIFNFIKDGTRIRYGNVIENDLEYKNAADVKVKVEAISMQRKGGKVVVELGDKDGETHTLSCPCDLSSDLLKKFASNEMQRLKVDGYRGTMTTFGYPRAEHGDVAQLSGTSAPLIIGEDSISDHNGAYFIDEVHKTFSTKGYRRVLTLGPKANGLTDFNGDLILTAA